MKHRLVVLASVLLAVVTALASCGPTTPQGTTTEPGTGATTTPTPTTPAPTTPGTSTPAPVTPAPSAPVYGGVLNWGAVADVPGFDNKFILTASTWTIHLTNDRPVIGDWAKGPAGSGEDDWILPGVWTPSRDVNLLITDWDLPDGETIVLHVRQGIRFHNKAPAQGREMDAGDVAYSIERAFVHKDSINYPKKAEDRVISIATPDKWTVVVKVPPLTHGAYTQNILTGVFVLPKELGLTGNLTDWKSAIGTGPYTITDYVRDSSITLTKNPTYWRSDPVHPENKLPYTDTVRALVIADLSTRMTAIRTGKIDVIRAVAWDTARDLFKTNPELLSKRYLRHTSTNIFMRIDKPELPYGDIRVRRALMMAIDREGIIEGFYGGNGEKFCHPVLPIGALSDIFVPLDEMPQTVQENYQYNPEKAKQLLTEAGHPAGFSATAICTDTQVDQLSIVTDYWKAIGVTLALDVKETGTWTSIQRSRQYPDMLVAPITNIYYYAPLAYLFDQTQYDRSWGMDQYVEDFYREKILPNRGPLLDATLRANYKQLVPYLADLVWLIPLPTPYDYTVWQPWVGGYHGEYSVGVGGHDNWMPYVWIDTALKK